MARPRKTDPDEPVDEQTDDEQTDEQVDDDELEQEVEDEGGSSDLSLRVLGDRVEIDLPRDGNERKTLDALGKLLDGMG